MRGDPPGKDAGFVYSVLSTPHARGSTVADVVAPANRVVYPACAGIHRRRNTYRHTLGRLPRMRGDPPVPIIVSVGAAVSTPHARGSTPESLADTPHTPVYPACAGIHPS